MAGKAHCSFVESLVAVVVNTCEWVLLAHPRFEIRAWKALPFGCARPVTGAVGGHD